MKTNKQSILICLLILVFCIFIFFLKDKILYYYTFLCDKERINYFITSYGIGAPIVFIVFQILQVIFAPVPGEVTGFIGGYIFGISLGFVYSSIGLTIGSLCNFLIGKFLGKNYIRKLIPKHHLERFDRIVVKQGIFIIFILFVFPGFPKDYLCLFLGLSRIPFKVFIILASIGRMPGTFILSLQGASIMEKMYGLAFAIFALFAICAFFAFYYKNTLYKWIEKQNIK